MNSTLDTPPPATAAADTTGAAGHGTAAAAALVAPLDMTNKEALTAWLDRHGSGIDGQPVKPRAGAAAESEAAGSGAAGEGSAAAAAEAGAGDGADAAAIAAAAAAAAAEGAPGGSALPAATDEQVPNRIRLTRLESAAKAQVAAMVDYLGENPGKTFAEAALALGFAQPGAAAAGGNAAGATTDTAQAQAAAAGNAAGAAARTALETEIAELQTRAIAAANDQLNFKEALELERQANAKGRELDRLIAQQAADAVHAQQAAAAQAEQARAAAEAPSHAAAAGVWPEAFVPDSPQWQALNAEYERRLAAQPAFFSSPTWPEDLAVIVKAKFPGAASPPAGASGAATPAPGTPPAAAQPKPAVAPPTKAAPVPPVRKPATPGATAPAAQPGSPAAPANTAGPKAPPAGATLAELRAWLNEHGTKPPK